MVFVKKAESRFGMTKKHHKKTFEKALEEGKVDEGFVELCRHLAGTKGYFTTSCCAGRIALMCLEEDEEKKENAFYRKWHRKVREKEVLGAIDGFKGECLWLKQEPLILHAGAKDLAGAKKLITIGHRAGIKRAGIMTAKNGKFIVEILGSQNMSVPVKGKGFRADEEYVKRLVGIANKKYENNKRILKRLENEIKRGLK